MSKDDQSNYMKVILNWRLRYVILIGMLIISLFYPIMAPAFIIGWIAGKKWDAIGDDNLGELF